MRVDADSDADDAARATDSVERALDAFRAGDPVCVHDFADREGETDIVYPAGAVDEAAVAHMRNDAGGLICVAVDDAVGDAFELPFLADAIDHPAVDDTPEYDDRSSFSLPVNHRETFTGITDEDRALTVRELGRHAADPSMEAFVESFRAPGHVHLLRAAPGLLADREGHTELGIALANAAGTEPAVVVCEMLDDETGGARSPVDARAYAARHDLVYVEGAALVDALR